MKKAILVITALVLFIAVSAQNDKLINSGKIIYEEVAKLDIKLDGDAAQFADMLPKENRSKKVLYFNEEASLYENDKDSEGDMEEEMDTGHGMMMIRMMEPENKYFLDIKKNKQVQQREFMTRMFLIEKKVDKSEWKMTGNQKTILDYPCQEATKENKEGNNVSAWFTSSIPISTGPSEYIGLPGMVLAVDINNGQRTINAISIIDDKPDNKILVKPKKGKKVSGKEFEKIVKEKMEEMGAEDGERGMMKVIIRD